MKKKEVASVERTFTEAEFQKYARAQEVIAECQLKSEGLAERIAGQLYIVSKSELYRIDNYSSMGEWAADKFEISKGTCSDAINTYERFGDKDKIGVIADKYADFMFSSLIAMKKLTDEEIESIGIKPTMSRAAIKAAIEARKLLEAKEAERPNLYKQIDALCKSYHALSPDKLAIRETIKAAAPDFFMRDRKPPISELETIRDTLTKAVDDLLAAKEEESSTVESPFKQEISDLIREGKETEEPETEETESIEPETEVTGFGGSVSEMAAIDEEREEPNTCPCYSINVNDYLKDGKPNKKAFLEAVWKYSQRVFEHNGELKLTWSE